MKLDVVENCNLVKKSLKFEYKRHSYSAAFYSNFNKDVEPLLLAWLKNVKNPNNVSEFCNFCRELHPGFKFYTPKEFRALPSKTRVKKELVLRYRESSPNIYFLQNTKSIHKTVIEKIKPYFKTRGDIMYINSIYDFFELDDFLTQNGWDLVTSSIKVK